MFDILHAWILFERPGSWSEQDCIGSHNVLSRPASHRMWFAYTCRRKSSRVNTSDTAKQNLRIAIDTQGVGSAKMHNNDLRQPPRQATGPPDPCVTLSTRVYHPGLSLYPLFIDVGLSTDLCLRCSSMYAGTVAISPANRCMPFVGPL
jgi:hypothetical protein